jgi:hypothetical protein
VIFPKSSLWALQGCGGPDTTAYGDMCEAMMNPLIDKRILQREDRHGSAGFARYALLSDLPEFVINCKTNGLWILVVQIPRSQLVEHLQRLTGSDFIGEIFSLDEAEQWLKGMT